ncbi:type 4 fimbrial biogenesis protein PilO [mine drainage metagenome]|uniref:Type 4 fimbrial biogenesis protein PilO n=1 Tax=mine drainage metagenome TaxID=410659 RepID=T1AAU8_9ZZZZ
MKWSDLNLKDFDLRDLNFRESASWPPPIKIVFGGLIVVMTVLLGYFLVISGEISTLHQEQRREVQLKQQFEQKAILAAALPAFKKQLKEMQQTYGQLLHQLPSRDEIPALLRDISTTAQMDGLKQRLFKPRSPIRKNFYAEQPIVMEYVGTYHKLGKFVGDLGALPRIVTLSDIVIKPTAKESTLLSMQVTGVTYRYLEHRRFSGAAKVGAHP